MAILKVAQAGHPILRKKTRPVVDYKGLNKLVEDMLETMAEYSGIGIAAPQVHVGLRVAIIGCRSNSRYPDAPELEPTVIVNPRVKNLGRKKISVFEGCLSVQGLRGRVERAHAIELEYWDLKKKRHVEKFEGFPAIVVQHEVDHLDGILYLDKAVPGSICFESEYERFMKAESGAE